MYSTAMAAYGGGTAASGLGSLVSGLAGGITSFFGGETGIPYKEIIKFQGYAFDSEKVKSNEGSIEFSLSHPDYPKINDKKLETRTFDLSTGDVVMFPSSLFHRTTPFSSSKKRVCFAFDLAPDELIR